MEGTYIDGIPRRLWPCRGATPTPHRPGALICAAPQLLHMHINLIMHLDQFNRMGILTCSFRYVCVTH